MTKAEWRTACRRVADERGRFVAEQPGASIMIGCSGLLNTESVTHA
jgi:hypothetical protein